ncbi:MAG TPA: hypothetical protein DCP11_09815 [Microbacteriaceae bacterium]|jgi:hypothetical protein|nr:hypothetical protein [Microbacteriaceae bacterium]
MAVKNDIIIGALRDHIDYDPSRYALTARNELDVLARQNEEYANEVRRRRKVLTKARRRAILTEDQYGDISQLALRRRVHTRLAMALDAVAADDDQVARIIEGAQQAASDEIRDAMSARLVRLAIDWRDPEYEQLRAERIQMFVLVNLSLLKSAHAVANGTALNEY